MSHLFWLTVDQVERVKPFFPKERGVGRVDDRKVLSGIIYVIKNGLKWVDAPTEYGPRKTLYNRFRRWSESGVFERIFEELAKPQDDAGAALMIDATHLKAHRTASSLKKRGDEPGLIGRTKGGLNTKLHALCDNLGRPIRLHLTEGQRSDFKGADVLLKDLPKTRTLIGDRGYDSNKIRERLAEQKTLPAYRLKRTAKKLSNTARLPTKHGIRLRTYSPSSKTGGASQHDMTDVLIRSDPPSISQQQSYSGYES